MTGTLRPSNRPVGGRSSTPNHQVPGGARLDHLGGGGRPSRFLGTDAIDVTIHGFDPAGAAGNLNATRHFATAADLRQQIVDARVFAGVHYRFSGQAGVTLGGQVAAYDLAHAFAGNGDK
jgi:hypothetical protein